MSSSSSTPELLKLSVDRAVWRVSWPMIALGLLRIGYYLTDSYWVGKLGPDALAALGGAAFAWWMIHLVCDLAGTGAQALVARHEGAGAQARIPAVLTQGLWLSLGVALFLATVAYSTRGVYFDILGFDRADPEHALGQAYLGASCLGAGALAVQYVIAAAFRGLGQTRTALLITAVTLVLNGILDPILIWGWFGAPALGIAGAAWATAVGNTIGALLGLYLLKSEGLALGWARPVKALILQLAKIGLPVTAGGVGFSAVYVVLGRFITDFGSEQMAALGVGHRLEGAAYMTCVGFSVGAAALVGQNLGAGRVKEAAQSAHRAAIQATAFVLPISVILVWQAASFMGLFTDDDATIAAGALYLRYAAPVVVFMAWEVVYEGAFAGAGDTVPPFVIGFLWTIARVPAAYLFAYVFGMGVGGVWLAIALSTVIKGVHMTLWFRRGRWVDALEV
jgi:putative MATE family efflux protein